MAQATESAVEAAVAVARAQGLRCDEPVVLRDAWHILLHLWPLPIVVRVSSGLPYPEGPSSDDVVRELRVAAHAFQAGAPVVPPASEVEAVPYEHDGRVVTFWRYVEPHDAPDPGEAGRALRLIHEALSDYDGPLPAFGHPADTEAMIERLGPGDDADVLRAAVGRRPVVDGQALHGDAHLGNCLGSPGGPLWHDFETACRGPREYDLAALMLRHRIHEDRPEASVALRGYGAHDQVLLEELLPIYVAWVTASMLIALPRRPELAGLLSQRLRWLRRGGG
jgi:Phosphotransferase enzyme family